MPKYQAIVRVERNDADFNLALRKPEFPDEAEAQIRRDKVIAASRTKYATPRAEVEAEILARIWGDKITPSPDEAVPKTPAPAPLSVPPPLAVLMRAK